MELTFVFQIITKRWRVSDEVLHVGWGGVPVRARDTLFLTLIFLCIMVSGNSG